MKLPQAMQQPHQPRGRPGGPIPGMGKGPQRNSQPGGQGDLHARMRHSSTFFLDVRKPICCLQFRINTTTQTPALGARTGGRFTASTRTRPGLENFTNKLVKAPSRSIYVRILYIPYKDISKPLTPQTIDLMTLRPGRDVLRLAGQRGEVPRRQVPSPDSRRVLDQVFCKYHFRASGDDGELRRLVGGTAG